MALFYLTIGLSACQTPYQADRWYRDGGYREVSTGTNSWRVEFVGNQNTAMSRVLDFSLLRAAELCQTASTRFMVVDRTEQRIEHFEEEEVEEVFDADGNVIEERTSTHIVSTPRVIRHIHCTNTVVPNAESHLPAMLASSIRQQYQLK